MKLFCGGQASWLSFQFGILTGKQLNNQTVHWPELPYQGYELGPGQSDTLLLYFFWKAVEPLVCWFSRFRGGGQRPKSSLERQGVRTEI